VKGEKWSRGPATTVGTLSPPSDSSPRMSRRFEFNAGTTICLRRHLIDLQHEMQRPPMSDVDSSRRPSDRTTADKPARHCATFHFSLFTNHASPPIHTSVPGSASQLTSVLRGVPEEHYERAGLRPGRRRF